MTPVEITHFTDPACPFAFSAEPTRQRLSWHYGEQLLWRTRMIVLTLEPGEAEKLASGAPSLQRAYGMPIDPAPRSRPASSEPACRAVVAARLNSPDTEQPLLRRLRVLTMAGGLLDDQQLIAQAALEAGVDPQELERWCASDQVGDVLAADIEAARSPSPAALTLDHKLSGPAGQRRYSAPTYELTDRDGGLTMTIPGFNHYETYEVAIANLAPELERRPTPDSAREVLEWATEPLATAEVAEIMQLDLTETRAALPPDAVPIRGGADFYWTL
jgi:predicted DsbA family dithiol-disulfide isomerase